MGSRLGRRAAVVAAAMVTVAGGAVVPLAARAAAGPCSRPMTGGAWPVYGGDVSGTQRQAGEHRIGPASATGLRLSWSTGNLGYQTVPIVSGGCVFVTSGGAVEARRLSDGQVVWRSEEVDATGAFAVAVVDGRVHVGLPNGGKPRAAALDVDDGHLLWQSRTVSFGHEADQLASAVVSGGVHALFTTGPDYDPLARPGFALLDAATGRVLKASTTIPEQDLAKGYAGGGIWGTPTVDERTGYLFAATANPYSKRREHAYDTAVLKLDIRRGRSTFGEIVASSKGSHETLVPGAYDTPLCQAAGEVYVDLGFYGGSVPCFQLDVDFGTGPTLYRDRTGRLRAAILQKSGVLHVLDAGTLRPLWTRNLGSHSFLTVTGGNISRIATDGRTLFVAHNPGLLTAIDAESGVTRWQAPLPGLPMKGGNVALANGVVYYVDNAGPVAFEAATGRTLWHADPPAPGDTQGSGVAVAGNRVVASCYGALCVFAPPPSTPNRSTAR